MNEEFFDELPEDKKQIIKRAYYAAFNKEITLSDFVTICRRTLTDVEFSRLFNQQLEKEQQNEEPVQKDEIKTENIEDIMQYSGVDLKEEADNIVREAEYYVSSGAYTGEDKFDTTDSLINLDLFREYVYRLCALKNLRVSEDGLRLLFMVIKRKILDFADKMDEACALRTEAELKNYSFQIDNEVSKQLWYLNELEKTKIEKLMIKKDEDPKKKKVIQEREDLLIKKKQSNTVAMAALGIKQKSWMVSETELEQQESNKFNPIYAPFDEKGFELRIKNRTITMKDFIYVLERDKRYNKSIFLIQYYFK